MAGLEWYPCGRLNMFRTLIHPSSGACDFSIVSPHWYCSCFDVCWSFGVAGLGWYLCGRLKHNMLGIELKIVTSIWSLILQLSQ